VLIVGYILLPFIAIGLRVAVRKKLGHSQRPLLNLYLNKDGFIFPAGEFNKCPQKKDTLSYPKNQ